MTTVEIVVVGNELLLGDVLDTNTHLELNEEAMALMREGRFLP